MFQFASQAMQPFSIWKSAFELYKTTFTKVWYLMFIPALLFTGVIGLGVFGRILNPNLGKDHPTFVVSVFALTLILLLLVLFYVFGVFLHRMKNLVTNPNMSLRESLHVVLRRSLPLITTIILATVAVAVGMMLSFLVFSALGKFTAIGGIFAIAAGIFLGILLIFAMPLVILDRMGPFTALKTSVGLVWKNWWHTLEGMYVPIFILSLALVFVQFLLSRNQTLGIVGAIIGFLVHALFINPYVFALFLVQMNDLKLRKVDQEVVVKKEVG